MRNTVIILLLFGMGFTMGCKKDSKVTDIINLSASMKCKVNGSQWTAITRVTTLQGSNLLVNGTTSTSGTDALNITVFNAGVGTFNLSTAVPVSTQFSATYTNDTGTTDSLYTAYSGTVTITKFDQTNKRVSGSFSFQAKNMALASKTITEGTFTELEYQ